MGDTSLWDWLQALTVKERRELADEIGYSHGYVIKMAYTRVDASDFVIREMLNSEFNKKPCKAGIRLTKAMAQTALEELDVARRKKRIAKNKS